MKLVNLFLVLALGLALTTAFNNPSVSVEEDFVGRDETTEAAATSMPKSELGDSTGQVSLTLSDGSTKTVDLYRDLKGGVAGHVELDAAQAFVGSEVTWSASGKGIPKLQGTLAKSPEGKHLLALKGKLGEGVGHTSHRRRENGGLVLKNQHGHEYGFAPGNGDCTADHCYMRFGELWDRTECSGCSCNFKVEPWYRISGSTLCMKYQAWEGGMWYYNLFQEAGNDGEVCVALSDGGSYSQRDYIINQFVNTCHLLQYEGCNGGNRFKDHCSSHWKDCMGSGATGYQSWSQSRRRAKASVNCINNNIAHARL